MKIKCSFCFFGTIRNLFKIKLTIYDSIFRHISDIMSEVYFFKEGGSPSKNSLKQEIRSQIQNSMERINIFLTAYL
jgi:hypothetical protein